MDEVLCLPNISRRSCVRRGTGVLFHSYEEPECIHDTVETPS